MDAEVRELVRRVGSGDAEAIPPLLAAFERTDDAEGLKRATREASEAIDRDPRVWDIYEPGARGLRDISRKLLEIHNRAAMRIHPNGGGSLYSTVDRGEPDPERACERCRSPGAYPDVAAFGAKWLCHGCQMTDRFPATTNGPTTIKAAETACAGTNLSFFTSFTRFQFNGRPERVERDAPGPRTAPSFEERRRARDARRMARASRRRNRG